MYMIAALLGINFALLVGMVVGGLLYFRKTAVRPQEESVTPSVVEVPEELKQKLAAEQEAFSRLMAYNTDTAYGLGREDKE